MREATPQNRKAFRPEHKKYDTKDYPSIAFEDDDRRVYIPWHDISEMEYDKESGAIVITSPEHRITLTAAFPEQVLLDLHKGAVSSLWVAPEAQSLDNDWRDISFVRSIIIEEVEGEQSLDRTRIS